MTRNINPNSLANLDPQARYKGKERTNLTLMPSTKKWLMLQGNVSETIDTLVESIQSGKLKWVEGDPLESNSDLIDQINALLKSNRQLNWELHDMTAALVKVKDENKQLREEIAQLRSQPQPKAIANPLEHPKLAGKANREVAEILGETNPASISHAKRIIEKIIDLA